MSSAPDPQGITVSRSLAWTMLVALIVGGSYVGTQVASLAEISRRQERHDVRIAAVELRIGSIERDAAVASSQRGTILALVEKIDARLARMEGRP